MTKLYLFVRRYLTMVLMFIAVIGFAQERTVSGKVTSSDDGSGIPGVNILEKGTSNGTVTDADGNFTISVGASATLSFSFVGYVTQDAVVGSQTSINIKLVSDVTSLSEVVVIGYGSVEKKDATGAIATLKPEDFNAGIISSPEQLIQGRLAGVQITSSSGEPGAGVNIRIRGTSSVRSGNNPLFVIDGVPLSGDDVSPGNAQGSALGDSPAKNPLNFLNPNDIASIDVLKDASATAIYGSRGANGVVLITTKSGKAYGGKGVLEYSYNVSASTITKKYDVLDRNGFLAAYTTLNGAAAAATVDRGGNTDWQDEILRTAISQQHNISYGTGDQSGDYRFSLGYADQQGIIKTSGLKRTTLRFNGTKKFLDDKFKIGTQMTISNTDDNNVPITNNAGFEGDLFSSALKSNPTAPVYSTTDPTGFYQPSNSEPNPVALLALSKSYTKTLRALGNIFVEVQIIKGLSFKTVLGFDRSFSNRTTAISRDFNGSNGIFGKGRLYLNDIQVDNQLWENYFTYDKEVGSGKLNVLLGYSYQRFSNATKDFQFTNFQTSDLDVMINNYASASQKPKGLTDNFNGGVVGSNSSNPTDELQSFYGRVNYTLNDKYIFTATLRADGSTRFGSQNKYGYFPSAAFKWRLKEESFLPAVFSDLNWRVGYGVTGNQEIPHNLYQQRQRFNNYTLDNDSNVQGGGISDVAFANPNLKWESTSQFSTGLDFGFFENRLRGSLDYYNKNTTDLLIQVATAQPAPQPFFWSNLPANVINKGFELSLEADPIVNNNFKWTVVANVAVNDNKVQNYNGVLNTGTINGQGLSGAFAQRIVNDQPLFTYFLRDFVGFNNGLQAYKDGLDAQVYVGKSPLPTTNLGFTNNFKYNRWDLSIFFSGQFGQYVYNNTANAYFTSGSLAAGRNVVKSVVGNGESKLNSPDVSTRFLENASFVRLQNVTLGYNLKSPTKSITSLRLFITGQNIFVVTDYTGQDPEVNVNKAINGVPSLGIDYAGYPRARTFTFGINASF